VTEDDELELRLKALREELMRHMDAVKNDVESVHTHIEHRFDKIDSDIKNLWRWVVGLVSVFGVIVAILVAAANII
jgi:tetrahydromethanopterin S-methyltransferase subunit G